MDREKVIKALQNCSVQNDVGCQCCPYFEERKTYGHEWCTTSMAQDALLLLKEQEAKTGKWIPIESPTGIEAFGVKEMTVMDVRCSVCGSEEDVSFTEYKYCPRCGANMEGRRSE